MGNTSKRVASMASKLLKKPQKRNVQKSVAGAALGDTKRKKK